MEFRNHRIFIFKKQYLLQRHTFTFILILYSTSLSFHLYIHPSIHPSTTRNSQIHTNTSNSNPVSQGWFYFSPFPYLHHVSLTAGIRPLLSLPGLGPSPVAACPHRESLVTLLRRWHLTLGHLCPQIPSSSRLGSNTPCQAILCSGPPLHPAWSPAPALDGHLLTPLRLSHNTLSSRPTGRSCYPPWNRTPSLWDALLTPIGSNTLLCATSAFHPCPQQTLSLLSPT